VSFADIAKTLKNLGVDFYRIKRSSSSISSKSSLNSFHLGGSSRSGGVSLASTKDSTLLKYYKDKRLLILVE